MKKIILTLGILLSVVLVFAAVDFDDPDSIYGDPMTGAEFKSLSDAELTDWDVVFRGTEEYYDDTQYYYYMNVYNYWRDDDGTETVTPVRDTFIISCDSSLYDCASFYNTQVLENQNAHFIYFKELQDEL